MHRANTGYEAYTGQRIADLSQNEKQGIAAARSNYGAFAGDYDDARRYTRGADKYFGKASSYINMANEAYADFDRSRGYIKGSDAAFKDFGRARQYIDEIGSVSDPGALEGYINPYLDEVLNPQLRRRNQAFEESRAEMERTAAMQGAFGGRQDIAEARLRQDHMQGLDDLYGSAYAGAFDRATALFGSEQDRKLQQAGAYADVGSRTLSGRLQQAGASADVGSRTLSGRLQQAGAFTDIGGQKIQQGQALAGITSTEQAGQRAALHDLMSTGLVGRTRDQAELDFKYLEYLEERDWDINNIGTLTNILATVPHEYTQSGQERGTSESHTVTKEKPSPLKTIAGIGAITAGAIMTGGASLGKTLISTGASALG